MKRRVPHGLFEGGQDGLHALKNCRQPVPSTRNGSSVKMGPSAKMVGGTVFLLPWVTHMGSNSRRVVVTGIGVISPLGSTKDALWDGLSAGRSAVIPASEKAWEPLPVRFAAPAIQFGTDDIDSFGPLEKERKKAIRKGIKMMCRECQMGLAAGQLALEDAKISPEKVPNERIGAEFNSDYMLTLPEEFIESVRSCLDENGEFQFSRWAQQGLTKMSPLWLLKYLPNMPAAHLAIYNDLRGPNNSLTIREAGANAAVAEAFQIILRDDADAMVVGSTGTRLHPMKTLHAAQHEELAECGGEPARASRPFDRNRTGAVLGEGAGAVILEELESAKARGATIYGEIVAGGTSSAIGKRLVANREKAMTNVLTSVLRDSLLSADEVGHLHAHGLSTRSCDVEEARAIRTVFGNRQTPLPVVAAKSNFGNLGAGSGMVELIASLLALQAGQLFPVLNYETPDPECPVAVVTEGKTPPGSSFINLSVTPQGQASAVLVRRFE